MNAPFSEIVILKLDNAFLCGDINCRTISNLRICPHCSSQTFSLAVTLAERVKKGRAA